VQVSQAPTAPVNMIGTIYHPHVASVNGLTRARAQAQGIVHKEPTRSKEASELPAKRDVPMDYLNVDVEL